MKARRKQIIPQKVTVRLVPAGGQEPPPDLKRMAGHRVWELNLITSMVRQVEIISRSYSSKGITERVLMQDSCIYCTAPDPHTADNFFVNILFARKRIAEEHKT